jgi:hemerythrin
MVARLGGDEFLIICPHTDLDGCLQVAQNVRASVGSLVVATGASQWRGSVSVGVSARCAAMTTIKDLLKAADDGVYLAKRAGRNCVRTADRLESL